MKILIIVLCIIAIILVLLAALLFVPVDVGVEYITRQNKKKSYLYFKVFKVIPIKIQLKQDKKKEKKPKEKQKEVQKEKAGFDLDKYLNLASSAADTYREKKDEIKRIAHEITEKVTFSEIIFDVCFGTGDAAKTGIMTGTVWSATAIFAGIIDHIFGVEKLSLNVSPCFEKKCFSGHFKSILKLRLVNIMIIIYKIMQVIDTFKEKSSANNEKAVL